MAGLALWQSEQISSAHWCLNGGGHRPDNGQCAWLPRVTGCTDISQKLNQSRPADSLRAGLWLGFRVQLCEHALKVGRGVRLLPQPGQALKRRPSLLDPASMRPPAQTTARKPPAHGKQDAHLRAAIGQVQDSSSCQAGSSGCAVRGYPANVYRAGGVLKSTHRGSWCSTRLIVLHLAFSCSHHANRSPAGLASPLSRRFSAFIRTPMIWLNTS